jgi:Ca2+-binding EF-hand superfamily protein
MNRNLHHTILFSMLGGLALTASAWGHDMGPAGDMHADGMFAQMDSNHDGRISAQENAAGAQAMFMRMDTNHDGKLSADEMAAGHKMMMHGDHDMDGMDHHGMNGDNMHGDGMHADGMHGDRMARMDSNHDGVLTAAEHAAAAQAMFDRMDSNHDGKVTSAEMEAAHKMMHGDHDSDEHGMKMGGEHGHGMHKGMGMDAMREMMDSNHDGVITAAEHAAGAQAMFARMDSNHDGYVSKEEMEAGHAAMKSP